MEDDVQQGTVNTQFAVTRERVVPIISASVSWLILGIPCPVCLLCKTGRAA